MECISPSLLPSHIISTMESEPRAINRMEGKNLCFMFLFCLVFAMFCARLFICALWSPAGKGLTSWLSFVVSSVSLSLSHWYPGSGVVLDCIDS